GSRSAGGLPSRHPSPQPPARRCSFLRRFVMFTNTAVALAAASLVLSAAALSPVRANYDRCFEEPFAKGCPVNCDVRQEPFYVAPSKRAEHEMHPATAPLPRRHHG